MDQVSLAGAGLGGGTVFSLTEGAVQISTNLLDAAASELRLSTNVLSLSRPPSFSSSDDDDGSSAQFDGNGGFRLCATTDV